MTTTLGPKASKQLFGTLWTQRNGDFQALKSAQKGVYRVVGRKSLFWGTFKAWKSRGLFGEGGKLLGRR